MTRWSGYIFYFMVFTAALASAEEDKERYIRENRFLEEELTIARRPEVYFVLNLKEKKVEIKAKGILMRELPIKGFRRWGSPVEDGAYHVRKKSAFFKPGRNKVRPGKNVNKEISRIDVLELANMPSRYAIVLDKGAVLFIRPASKGIVSGLGNLLHSSENFFIRPISMLWHALRGKHYTAIDIVLDKNDARAIYWSLSEGSGVIVYPS